MPTAAAVGLGLGHRHGPSSTRARVPAPRNCVAACLALASMALVLGCGTRGAARDAGPPFDAEGVDAGVMLPPIPRRTAPCTDASVWTEALRSSAHPVLVHYRTGERAVAEQVLAYLETAWRFEVDDLGFSEPLPDGARCGPDDAYDVFLWPGSAETYVEAIADNPATPHDDWFTFMVVDPYGEYGGEVLDATIAHELNHALQATDDWWESVPAFEMTATFVESLVFDEDDAWMSLLVDFQSRPDHSIDRNDDYETWFMYAAALYLHFLRERYFDGDASFVSRMWRLARSPPGAEDDPLLNEPDFEDALSILLAEGPSITFADSVAEFARWRYYVGSRDDGRHFAEGARFGADAEVPMSASLAAVPSRHVVSPAPMLLGTAYVELTGGAGASVSVDLEASPGARWIVQAVPGLDGSDGEVVDLSSGARPVALGRDGRRVLVITALPLGADDPDGRTDQRFDVTVVLGE